MRDKTIVNDIRRLTDADVNLTIEVYPIVLEDGSEQHAIGKDIMGKGKNIGHMLTNQKPQIIFFPHSIESTNHKSM